MRGRAPSSLFWLELGHTRPQPRIDVPTRARTLAADTVTEKCSGNHEAAADVDTLVGGYYAIDCGPGYALKAGHAAITADGVDFDAKRTQCCNANAGFCAGNAASDTNLDFTAAEVAPYGFDCGAGYLVKDNPGSILADGSDLAAMTAQCCDG